MNSTVTELPARSILRQAVIATLIMAAALGISWWLTPTRYWFNELGRPNLQQIVPPQFGDWVSMDKTPVMIVDPEQTEMLRVIYSQTLSRVYVNRRSGHVIMLSIAVGMDQSRATQLHRPEMCYRAQGFVVDEIRPEDLRSPGGAVKLTRLVTHSGLRREPVSYWIRVGQRNTRGSLDMNLSRLELAARGYIADGLLFRVSEVSNDPDASFLAQDHFIKDLLSVLTPPQRAALLGPLISR